MSDTLILIAATEAKGAVDVSRPLKDQARQAMNITNSFWLSTDQEVRFRGAIAALLLANKGNEEITERINMEMRSLNALAAMTGGVPVDVERLVQEIPDDFEPVGFMGLWKEITT